MSFPYKVIRMTDEELSERNRKPTVQRKEMIKALVGLGSGEAIEIPERDILHPTLRNHVFYANRELKRLGKKRRLCTSFIKEFGNRRTRIECVPFNVEEEGRVEQISESE